MNNLLRNYPRGEALQYKPVNRYLIPIECPKNGHRRIELVNTPWPGIKPAPEEYKPITTEVKDVGSSYTPVISHYEQLGASVGALVAEKQAAYGDSFGRSGECLRQMFPDGIDPSQYGDLLTIARILDKLFRIASDPDAFDENPYRDIAGYALLGMKRYEDKQD